MPLPKNLFVARAALAFTLALASIAACAQQSTAATPGSVAGAGGAGRGAKMRERFAAADTNGDGRLTREEAVKMPMVEKNFDAIDVNHTGSVTMADIRAFAAARRAAGGGGAGGARQRAPL